MFWVNWLKWFYPMMSPALPRRDHKVVLITNYWTSAYILIFLSLTAGLGLCQQFASVFNYGWMSFFFLSLLIKYQQISNKTFTLCTSFGSQLNLFLNVCVCVCLGHCAATGFRPFSVDVTQETCYHCKCQKYRVSMSVNWLNQRIFI